MFNESICRVIDFKTISYAEALGVQKRFLNDVISGESDDVLIICRHPHTITLGRRADKKNILVCEDKLKALGVDLIQTDRGGDVTYHGPGQLVFYPIMDLKKRKRDINLYLRMLEEVVIRSLRDNFGLNAYRLNKNTGVWVGPYKVASIGISVRKWVTSHGFSLNVEVEKEYLSLIRPCGLDTKTASINDFFHDRFDLQELQGLILENFSKVFGLKIMEDAGNGESLLAGFGRKC